MFNKFLQPQNITISSSTSFLDNPSITATLSPRQAFINHDDMKKGHRPPPLNLGLVVTPKSLPRISRTPVALITKELTPLLTPLPEELDEPADPAVRAVRIAVDFMQILACLVVVVILGLFLTTYSGSSSSLYTVGAILLSVALVSDIGLGLHSIRFYDRPWTSWAVIVRALTASTHVACLLAFILAGRVFPEDYTYWNLTNLQTGGPVLGLVAAILGWDIAHVILSLRFSGCSTWVHSCWHTVAASRKGRRRGAAWRLGARRGRTASTRWTCAS